MKLFTLFTAGILLATLADAAKAGNLRRELWGELNYVGRTCHAKSYSYGRSHVKYDGIVHARCECDSDKNWQQSGCAWPTATEESYPNNDYLKSVITCGNPSVIPAQVTLDTSRTKWLNEHWVEVAYEQRPDKWLTCPQHTCQKSRTSTDIVIHNYPKYDPHADLNKVLNTINTVLDVGSFVLKACNSVPGHPAFAGCAAAQNSIGLVKTFTNPAKGVFGFLFPQQQATQLHELCAKDGLQGDQITPEQFQRCLWNSVGSITLQLVNEQVNDQRIRDLRNANENLLLKVNAVTDALDALAKSGSANTNELNRIIHGLLGDQVMPLLHGHDDARFEMRFDSGNTGVEETVELANRAEIEIRARQLDYIMDCDHQTDRAFDEVTNTIQGHITELESRVPKLKANRMNKIGELEITAGQWYDTSKMERIKFSDDANSKCPYSFDVGNGYHSTWGPVTVPISCGRPGNFWGAKQGPVWDFVTKCRDEHIAAITQQQDAFWGLYVGMPDSKAEQWKRMKAVWVSGKAQAQQICSK